jgi:hypothetical protein
MSKQENDMNAITKTEPSGGVTSYSDSLLEVIAKAARDPNVDIDKMERLLEMQERVQARDAEQAFSAAFAEMQPHLPHITVKNKIVHNGKVISEYADWPSISAAITPVLSEFGFSLNFGGNNDANEKTTVAKLRHVQGHIETNQITLPHDTSGAKNKVQAIGSSSTYGQRYAACPLVGVVVHGSDDDGAAASGKPRQSASEAVLSELTVKCEAVTKATGENQVNLICNAYSVGSLDDLTANQARQALKRLKEKLEAANG